ncbi:IclR family transcriptional regulator [Pseudomonas urmiensis]|uniref:IclR family transcriptional regulator n=1 Tax=Pseudomonas urmiensis TaxID=2745493 RepID=UPI003D14AE22
MSTRSRHIQSVERAMALLEQLNARPHGTALVDLCKSTGLSKSTAHGLLNTLVDLGYAVNAGSEYRPGARVRTLSPAEVDSAEVIRHLFAPALQAFNEICRRDSYLAIPSGTRSYLTLDGLDSRGMPVTAGTDPRRDAIRTSAIGKIFLANDQTFIRRVRRNAPLDQSLETELQHVNHSGFALDQGASRQGLYCLAIPLRHKGRLVGALGASGFAIDMDCAWMQMHAKRALREIGALVSL